MAKKKDPSDTSRITRTKSTAPKASRKRTRLTDEAVAEFVAAPTEVSPPETAWSPVERIHLEEVAVEEIQIEEILPVAPESSVPTAVFTAEERQPVPWLDLGRAELLRSAFARLNRGFLARWIDRNRPYGERVLGRFEGLLGRFGIRVALR